MPKAISTHNDRSIRDWVPSPLAPRSGLRLMPAPLTVPNLRTFDSTESWSPHTKWPITPVPDDSSSQQADNTADLITSDDPWYLDAAAKLIIEKIPQSMSRDQPDFETVYGILKNCSDTRLPLELFASAVNLMEAFPSNGRWVERWITLRPQHPSVHEYDDCLPEGDPIPSPQGAILPSYFRHASETPSPPSELFVLAVLACSSNLLAASAHPLSQNYSFHSPGYWAILVSHGRFGVSQLGLARDILWREVTKMNQDQLWGKMHRRMDQIDRHAARTAKEEAEDEINETEDEDEGIDSRGDVRGISTRMGRMGMDDAGAFEGSGQDWDDDDESGGNKNKKIGTEETRSVTVYGWLDGLE